MVPYVLARCWLSMFAEGLQEQCRPKRQGHLMYKGRPTKAPKGKRIMTWSGKPCARCDGKKGPKYMSTKYCGKCAIQVKKDRRASAHEAAVIRRYGIEPGDYQRLYDFQGGRCAICRRATGLTRRLSVDHDHQTGNVRGLLCRPCNDMLGHARDDALFFSTAIHYLGNPPAAAAKLKAAA